MKNNFRFAVCVLALFVFFPRGLGRAAVVEWITIDGAIGPVAAHYIHEGIDRAQDMHAECLVIEMDTPGGLMKSMRMICKDILAA